MTDLEQAARALLEAWDDPAMPSLLYRKQALRAALAAAAGRVSVPCGLHYELDGVIADVEQGNGFDAVCLATIKRVRDVLAAAQEGSKNGS